MSSLVKKFSSLRKSYRILLIFIATSALAYVWWDNVQTTRVHVACTDSFFVRMNLYDAIWNSYIDDQNTVRVAAKKDEENPSIATWDDMGQSLFDLTSNLAHNGAKLNELQPLICLTNIEDKTIERWEGWENVTNQDLVKLAHDMSEAHEALVLLIDTSVDCYTSILSRMESPDTGMDLASPLTCKASERAADAIPPIAEEIAGFTRLMAP